MGHEFYSIRRLICLRGVYINDMPPIGSRCIFLLAAFKKETRKCVNEETEFIDYEMA